jgi:hypothetical protein
MTKDYKINDNIKAMVTNYHDLANNCRFYIGHNLNEMLSIASLAKNKDISREYRTYLNDKYQNLKYEIVEIGTLANYFTHKNLFHDSPIYTETQTLSTPASGCIEFTGPLKPGEYIQFFGSDETAPHGFSRNTKGEFIPIKFNADDDGRFARFPSILLEIITGDDADSQANYFLSMIDQLTRYSGDDFTILQAKKIVSAFEFNKYYDSNVEIKARAGGSYWNKVDILVPDSVLINGVPGRQNLAYIEGIDGALPAGEHSDGPSPYSYSQNAVAPSVYALGRITDSLLAPLDPIDSTTTGIDFSNISNNPYFIGKMPEFSVSYVDTNCVDIAVDIGEVTYISKAVNSSPDSENDNPISFYSKAGYGSFSIQMQPGKGFSVWDQIDADSFASRLDRAFSGIEIYQKREITSFVPAGYIIPIFENKPSGNLAHSKFWIISDDFENLKFEDVTVRASGTFPGISAEIIFTINGEDYKSGYQYDGSPLPLSHLQTPNTLTANDAATAHHDGKYGFVNQKNPNKILIYQYNSNIPLRITNEEEASALENSLEKALNIGASIMHQKFQMLSEQISSLKAQNIFSKFDTDLLSAEHAKEASEEIDRAIGKVGSD